MSFCQYIDKLDLTFDDPTEKKARLLLLYEEYWKLERIKECNCECGSKFLREHLPKHKRSKKHLEQNDTVKKIKGCDDIYKFENKKDKNTIKLIPLESLLIFWNDYKDMENTQDLNDTVKKMDGFYTKTIAITYLWSKSIKENIKSMKNILTYYKLNCLKETTYCFLDFMSIDDEFWKSPDNIDNFYSNADYHFVLSNDIAYRLFPYYELYVRLHDFFNQDFEGHNLRQTMCQELVRLLKKKKYQNQS
eukprot:gene6197-10203_t